MPAAHRAGQPPGRLGRRGGMGRHLLSAPVVLAASPSWRPPPGGTDVSVPGEAGVWGRLPALSDGRTGPACSHTGRAGSPGREGAQCSSSDVVITWFEDRDIFLLATRSRVFFFLACFVKFEAVCSIPRSRWLTGHWTLSRPGSTGMSVRTEETLMSPCPTLDVSCPPPFSLSRRDGCPWSPHCQAWDMHGPGEVLTSQQAVAVSPPQAEQGGQKPVFCPHCGRDSSVHITSRTHGHMYAFALAL